MVVPWPRKGPTCSRSVVGLPRLKVCCHSKPSRRMTAIELARQGVDDGGADAVQAAGVFVALPVAELAAGVQRGQHQLDAGFAIFRMHVHRNTAAVVGHGHGVAVLVERDGDGVGVAVEVLIHGVIDDLPDEMVQPLGVHAADVHGRAFADGFQAFENLEGVGGGVFAGGG